MPGPPTDAYTLERNDYVWAPPGLEVSDNIINEQFIVNFQKVDPYTRTQQVYGEGDRGQIPQWVVLVCKHNDERN